MEGSFAVVLLAFNTLFALPNQDAQIACFRNAARHLAEEGVFLISGFVPDPARFDRGQRVHARAITTDEVRLDVAEHDPTIQTTRAALVRLRETGVRILPVMLRYAWPSELDLMGRLAGLRLVARWGGWRRQPFSNSSTSHVSVYTSTVH
ncbi:MAG: SAM-dependent methyltransferase, partial [Actinomycetota bacterium]|nr:SAM-dependent methyltransferase [Actinomycetota bacterium]